MALGRKLLESLGLNDSQIETIIEAHSETVTGLKSEIAKYKESSEKLVSLQKELEELSNGGWKDKFEKAKDELEDLRKSIESEKSKAAKENAARFFFESQNILGKNLDIAMRGSKEEINAAELDESGDIKDKSPFEKLVSGDFAALVSVRGKKGADTAKPHMNNGGTVMSKAEIYRMENGRYVLSSAERQAELEKLIASER